MQYTPPTQKNIWRLALFFNHFSIKRKVIFESFLYDPRRPVRRKSYKMLPPGLMQEMLFLHRFSSDKHLNPSYFRANCR
jgi:hypothetical protein